jgi:preprotein translocase subunit YajC
MEITLLIKSISGLIVILSILIFFWLISPTKKKKKQIIKKVKETVVNQKVDLDSLRAVLRDKKTSTTALKKTLDLILKHHGKIHKKMGIRSHPDLNIYIDILVTICRHPNTDKRIIIDFDNSLQRLNPQYKSALNDAVTKGLNSRGL